MIPQAVAIRSNSSPLVRRHSFRRIPIFWTDLTRSVTGYCGLHFFLRLLLLLRSALVVQLPPLADADGELDPGPLEMDVEGDQGQAFLIELPAEFVDLAAVSQQPASPQWIVIEIAA